MTVSTKGDSVGGVESIYERQLHLEATGSTNGTDNYFSAWLPTTNTLEISVTGWFPGSGWAVSVQESTDANEGHVTAVHSLGSVSGNIINGTCSLTARYFRVRVETTYSGSYFIAVRAISII